MIDVALCIGLQHDPWLVALAMLVCCVGAFAIMQMFGRAQATEGMQRAGWLFLTSVGAGATIWCTHFIAMLAYKTTVPVRLDPVLTILSLLIAIAGAGAGFAVAGKRKGPLRSILGGAIVGLAISIMHFTGMAAYRIDGLIEWRAPYVVTAVLCAVVFAAAAVATLNRENPRRHSVPLATALLVTAIVSLHFVAMTALRILPLRLSGSPLDAGAEQALGLATALVGLIVIAAGVAAAFIDRSTRSDAMKRLRQMAMNDLLTGLPNRAAFQQALFNELTAAQADAAHLAIVVIDLKRFKEINDVHGHKAGDDVLVGLARRMRYEMGADGTIARLGGDEFGAILRFKARDRLVEVVQRLQRALEAPIVLDSFNARVGASIGVAVYPDDASDADTLANNADLAMYRAKSGGSVAPCFYNAGLDELIRERRELAKDLRDAIETGGLDIHYQVQTSVATGATTGYEALARWTHPSRGPISPTEFIPLAEEHGLILALGEWVLRRACADAAGWDHQSKVAVNLSPVQLIHPDLPRRFHEILLETGLPPDRLEIELTETAIITNRDQSLHALRQIKAFGVSVALDDFGTGYSSLETLRAFPFDKIKLDRLFISELDRSPQAVAIVRAVLALGRSLAIPILAEGIETESQLHILKREGCDEAQGFLFGHPRPLTSLVSSCQTDISSRAVFLTEVA
jgi:diguanylate cyclase (GGDEF)-like protein